MRFRKIPQIRERWSKAQIRSEIHHRLRRVAFVSKKCKNGLPHIVKNWKTNYSIGKIDILTLELLGRFRSKLDQDRPAVAKEIETEKFHREGKEWGSQDSG